MEFLLYLTPIGAEIVQNINKTGYSIKENIEYCRDKDLFGYTQSDKIVVCTSNIEKSGHDVKFYVNETIYHEGVHVAHMCNGNKPLNISVKDMPLSKNKLNDVRRSSSVSKSTGQMEHEAYWMEDKPKKVNYVIKKYCM